MGIILQWVNFNMVGGLNIRLIVKTEISAHGRVTRMAITASYYQKIGGVMEYDTAMV